MYSYLPVYGTLFHTYCKFHINNNNRNKINNNYFMLIINDSLNQRFCKKKNGFSISLFKKCYVHNIFATLSQLIIFSKLDLIWTYHINYFFAHPQQPITACYLDFIRKLLLKCSGNNFSLPHNENKIIILKVESQSFW